MAKVTEPSDQGMNHMIAGREIAGVMYDELNLKSLLVSMKMISTSLFSQLKVPISIPSIWSHRFRI